LPLLRERPNACLLAFVSLKGEGNDKEWGMIAAAAGLMMVGVFFAVRKRMAQVV